MNKDNQKEKNTYNADILKNITIGGLAGVISRTVTAPIELYKIQRQNYFIPHANIKDVIQMEGVRGLWKGNLINCLRIFPHMGLNYGTIQMCKSYLQKNTHTTNTQQMIVSSTMGGAVATIATNPLEMVKTRLCMQMNKNSYHGILHAFRTTPVRELYYGIGISLVGFIPFNVISFTVYHQLKQNVQKYSNVVSYPNKSSTMDNIYRISSSMLCGGISGAVAISITYPTDLLRRRLHIQGFHNTAKQYHSTMDCIHQLYQKEGIRGFYRGLTTTYVKLFSTMAVQFLAIDELKRIIIDT